MGSEEFGTVARPSNRTTMSRPRMVLIAVAVATLVVAGLAFEIISTAPVRGAIRTCSELFTVANRPGLSESERLAGARALCSRRYLQTHQLAVADPKDGGLVGVPRNFNKNFEAWRQGPNVWVCPTGRTNRVVPIYQFVWEDGRWRFDGPIGLLTSWGEIVPVPTSAGRLLNELRPLAAVVFINNHILIFNHNLNLNLSLNPNLNPHSSFRAAAQCTAGSASPGHGSLRMYPLLSDAATAIRLPSGLNARL
jgi:hypothetical protein